MSPGVDNFSVQALIRAMAPIHVILERIEATIGYDTSTSQHDFVELFDQDILHYLQGTTFLRKLIQTYLASVEQRGEEFVSEELYELLSLVVLRSSSNSMKGRVGFGSNSLTVDAQESAIVSFLLPVLPVDSVQQQGNNNDSKYLKLRVFPRHNDVGVRKVWEAGACLTEYILSRPQLVEGKSVVELGAGVGATGIGLAMCCNIKSIKLTDYTTKCLDNISYNIDLNRPNYISNEIDISTERLEWAEFGNKAVLIESHEHILASDVLLAADVAYDNEVIPDLVKVVRRFLQTDERKYALFGTTFRHEETFDLFKKTLSEKGISCEDLSDGVDSSIPFLFPSYFIQKRDEIRLTRMRCAS